MYGLTDRWMYRPILKQTDLKADWLTKRQTYRWTDGRTKINTDRQACCQPDGLTDKQESRQAFGRMNRQTHQHKFSSSTIKKLGTFKNKHLLQCKMYLNFDLSSPPLKIRHLWFLHLHHLHLPISLHRYLMWTVPVLLVANEIIDEKPKVL
jgi:hypothetical protein